jgi:aromatic ring-opening dioxygenase LigB subunit
VSLVFAAIAPHGDLELDADLRAAMEELGRRCEAAALEVAVIVTPHSVHVEGHFAVVTAGKVGEWETDADVAATLLGAPLPILGVSFGGNDPATAEFPLDWGTEVPLAFLRAPRVVVVSPARDRPLEEHVRLGQAIGELSGRVALIASADHGHAQDHEGLYGFDPAAAAYDARLQEILASDRLESSRSQSSPRRPRRTRSGSSPSSRARSARLPALTFSRTQPRRTTGCSSPRSRPRRAWQNSGCAAGPR